MSSYNNITKRVCGNTMCYRKPLLVLHVLPTCKVLNSSHILILLLSDTNSLGCRFHRCMVSWLRPSRVNARTANLPGGQWSGSTGGNH